LVTNPWSGGIETIYRAENMHRSRILRGLCGTVSDAKQGREWDWRIEIFLGTIWEDCKGDFDTFTRELFKVWLHEFLHIIYRWERVNSEAFLTKNDEYAFIDEEKPVETWVQMLTS